jgi:hypothetical protein
MILAVMARFDVDNTKTSAAAEWYDESVKQKRRPFFASKRRKVAAGVVVAAVLIGAICYYAAGTPAYSMFRLYRAYKTGDIRGALKYIDVQAVLEHAAERVRSELGDSAPQSREEFVDALKPLIAERIRDRLIGTVVGDDSGSQYVEEDLGDQLGGRLFSIEREGANAEILLRNGLRIGLRQTRDRYWRIVSIEGLITLTPEDRALFASPPQREELRGRILERIKF